ncbi:recombinase family protein [Streptomyces sp. NPDC001642]|uniref:recombinase family protein n=1 Tax=Streptomyces sp. NPDC001642 TaxID=3154392 RepID=UPI00333249C1
MTSTTIASAAGVVGRATSPQPVVRVAVYARVSTDDQVRGYGLDSQIDGCNEYVSRKSWSVYDVYKDEGVSAR